MLLAAAGCADGGEERTFPSELAVQLAARSEAAAAHLEAGEFCAAGEDAAALQSRTIAAINAGQVPAELQEELLGSVNALVEAISCTPPAADDSAADDARELTGWIEELGG